MALISVIVPVYNVENYLSKCIDSILNQTFSDFELLLIDDGSTDNSGYICDSYAIKDVRIKVFHKENGGVSSARNVGINNASGEWITFCDSDDYVLSNWLEIFVSNCQGYDLVSQGLIFGNTNKIKGVSFKGNVKGGFCSLAQQVIVGYVYIKLFRLDIIRKYNLCFNECFKFREDEDFVLKYLNLIDQMICVDEAAYIYNLPDLKNKYIHIDNFYCSCSMFSSVHKLFGKTFNHYGQAYLNELTNTLFSSFEEKKKDRKKKLITYQQCVGKYVLYSELSLFSKFVFLIIRNSTIASLIFDMKAKVLK